MKRKVKRPFDNEQFRKGYVAGIFAAEKELNTELVHFAEKAHKIMSEGTFPDYGVKINFKDFNNTITTNLDMKTEEKAKKYDEALEWMRELYPGLHGATKEDAEHYFPELKESEDEKMIGVIRLALTDVPEERFTTEGTSLSEVFAWMEKQKEQKPSINIDQLKSLMLQYLQEASNEKEDSDIEADTDKWARKILGYGFKNGFDEGVESVKPAEWSEEDENKLNHILEIVHIAPGREVSVDEKEELESFLKSLCPQPKAKLTRLDENIIKAAVAFVEQNDHFNCWGGIDKHTVIKALRSLKSHQKSAEWSEEDEEMRKTIIQVLKSFVSQADCESNPSLSASYPTYYKEIDWFETLPERFNLQPKQEWSKEDRDRVAQYLHDRDGGMLWSKATEITSDILDILRPQPYIVFIKDAIKFGNLEYERGVKDGIQHAKNHHWKPSEKQPDAEHYFPELKESEESKDERIRKAIVELVKRTPSSMFDADTVGKWIGASHDEILAYLEKQKEQKPVEYLSKEKVFAIMNKLTSLSFCVPLGSDEEKKIHEITCDVSSLLNYPIEQKPAVSRKETLYQLFQNGLITLSDYLYLTEEQKPAEWSEEDEEMLVKLLDSISIGNNYEEMRNWLLPKLKSLHPQPKQEQKHYWKPTETDVALFNKAVTTNETLTPAERAQLDIIRSKFGYCRATNCSGIVQSEQKSEVKLKCWVARDKEYNSDSGLGLVLFKEKPRRSCDSWIGAIASLQLAWEAFPDLKWEDEPMEVEVIITKK